MLNGSSKTLKVCPFCLGEWDGGKGWEGYSSASKENQARIKEEFTISEFFMKRGALPDSDIWKGINIPPEITDSKPAAKTSSASDKAPEITVPGCYLIYTPLVYSAGFHFMDCSILKADCAHNWTGGYRRTGDLSGKFTVYVKSKNKDGGKIPQPTKLSVCPVCLAEYNNNQGWNGFSLNDEQKKLIKEFTIKGLSMILQQFYGSLTQEQKAAIANFNIQEFFRTCGYKSQIPDEILNKIWACNIDPDNLYSTSWQYAAKLDKIPTHYRCEQCGVELSNNKILVVLHHINGLHPDVRPENFRVLCKMCHSKQWRHDSTVKLTEGEKFIIEKARREQKILPAVKNND